MEQAGYIATYFIGLCALISTGFFGFKLFEIIEKRRSARFKNQDAEFISDLYKLHRKWTKRGSIDYAKAISIIIDGFSFDENEPETEYGKSLRKQLELR